MPVDFLKIADVIIGESDSIKSQFTIESISGDYDIFIDDKNVQSVRDKTFKTIPNIEPGLREIKLKRTVEGKVEDFFYVFEREIFFLPGFEVKFSWDAGPSLDSSTGVLQYFKDHIGNKGVELFLLTTPKIDTLVSINDNQKKENLNNYNLATNKITNILIEPVEKGFEAAQVKIDLSQSFSSASKLNSNLQLIVEVFLYKQPFI